MTQVSMTKNELWCMHKTEYHSATKKNEVLVRAPGWTSKTLRSVEKPGMNGHTQDSLIRMCRAPKPQRQEVG